MTNLSIVVITRNRLEKLKRCLESVGKTFSEPEIIVVDNGSNDGTREYLKEYKEIKTVFLDKNIGVASARNIGIKLAMNDFVMFVDDDVWVEQLDFEKITDYFAVNPKVGIVAPRLLNPNGDIQESIRHFPTVMAIFWRGTGLYKILPNVPWYRNYLDRDFVSVHQIDWAIGACQIIRKGLFDEIGYLDENYFFGYEDTDFCRRASVDGYSTVYWPEAMIFHEYARTSSKGLNMSLLRHIKSIVRFFLKQK